MSGSFFEAFLPNLYRSAETSDHWCYALDQLKSEMQVGSAVIQLFRHDDNLLKQQWAVRDTHSTEQAAIHDRLVNNDSNPRYRLNERNLALIDARVFHEDDGDPLTQPQFRALRQRLQYVGLGRSITLQLPYHDGFELSLILHRHYDDSRAFTRKHENMLRRIAPHIQQAISLAEKVDQISLQKMALEQPLNTLNTGVIIVDELAGIHWINQCAKTLLLGSNILQQNGTTLRCVSATDQLQLQELIQECASSPGDQHRVLTTLGQLWNNPLQVMATPLQNPEAGQFKTGARHVALYLTQAALQSTPPNSAVKRLFGLTDTEATLAIALCNGYSLNDYSQHRGISVKTARIQLKSIFAKLGVNRQPDLIRLLLSSVAFKTHPAQ